jgi:mannose-6-phosphate isomerase-like protein (cupin superfamily)
MAPTPGQPVSIDIAPHYSWGAGCEGWHLVQSPALSVIQEHMPPRTAETRHRHAVSRQFFFVLRGQLTIEVDGDLHAVASGTGLEIEPGRAHTVHNNELIPAEFLVVSQPPSHDDREPASGAR